jgi:hypothetical protein
MTYTDILNAVISHKHGGMVADQFRDVMEGGSLLDQNQNAVMMIWKELVTVAQAFQDTPLGEAAGNAAWRFE